LTLLRRGQVAEAAAAMQDSLLQTDQQHALFTHDAALVRVELLLAQDRLEEVLVAVDEEIERLVQGNGRLWLPPALYIKAQALLRREQTEEARRYLAEAIERARGIGARQSLWRVVADLAALEPDEAAAARWAEARAEIDFLAANTWPDEARAAFLARPDVQRVLVASSRPP
jgi:hypothetical protein